MKMKSKERKWNYKFRQNQHDKDQLFQSENR